jgi:hypothetical protein
MFPETKKSGASIWSAGFFVSGGADGFALTDKQKAVLQSEWWLDDARRKKRGGSLLNRK